MASWVTRVFTNLTRGIRQVGGVWFYPLGFSSFSKIDCLKAFNEVPELNAIINFKARAFCAGTIYRIDKEGVRLPDDDIIKLLNRPNWFQGGKEFLRQTKLFHEIYGDEYLYAWYGVGMKRGTTKAFYTLPPNLIECRYTSEMPYFMTSKIPEGITYTYRLMGNEKTLNGEQIIHLNDNRVTITDETAKLVLNGESKMIGLTPVINNLRLAYETRGVILKRRGALGVLSNEGSDVTGQIPLEPSERESVQEQYRKYGGLEGQDNIIITNAKMRWQQMAVAPDKLGLFQETREDFLKICDGYGVAPELFGSDKGVTYENQNEALKRTYDNTVIPEANEWIGAVDMFFYPDVMDGSRLIMDYSNLAIYQEDLELNGRALGNMVSALSTAFTDGAINIKQYQEEMNKFGIGVGTKPI